MRPIQVWPWYESPEEYRLENNDDKDWIALVPAEYIDIPLWVERLGACETTIHPLANGDWVCIGAHG